MKNSSTPRTSSAASVFQDGLCAPEHRRFLLIAAVLASALGFIDGTVVSIALPAMRATLDADLVQAQWIHNAYMVTLSALILVGGAAGDRFGLARVFACGIALFVLASVICALAPSAQMLIVARAVQGIGAAIMVPGSLALIARAYPRAERGRAIGIWAAASALTTASGPVVGGLALTLGGDEMWRWIFAINLPFGALAIGLLWKFSNKDRIMSDTPIDWAGAITGTFALLALAWGLTGSEGHGLNGAWFLAGLAALSAFLWIEATVAAPMMPLSLFQSRIFSAANLLSFTLYSALSVMLFFLPMTLVAGWGLREIEAAAAFAPLSVFISIFSARFGRLADITGPAPFLSAGSAVAALGYLLVALLSPYGNFWGHVLPSMCLVGFGMALVVAPLSSAIMGAIDDHQSGIASGVNNAVTRMAGLMSVAAVGGLVSAIYTQNGGTASFGLVSDTELHGQAMNAAFRVLAFVAAGLAILSAVIGFATKAPVTQK